MNPGSLLALCLGRQKTNLALPYIRFMIMIPVDGSPDGDFEGIDYTAYFQGPAVYDSEAATERVLTLLDDFLKEKGLSSRKCWHSGFGAAAGAPAFFEILLWIQEHWEFLAGAASVVLARVANVRDKWRQLKRKVEENVFDPYKPTFVVELGVRVRGEGNDARREAAQSFRALLTHVPDINALLRRELPDQRFTFRTQTTDSSPFTHANFRVPEIKRSDVAKIIRFLEKKEKDDQDGPLAVLLYRRFGFITRLEVSENGRNFMLLSSR